MTKEAYLKAFLGALEPLSDDERRQLRDYYEEMLCDGLEKGLTEPTAEGCRVCCVCWGLLCCVAVGSSEEIHVVGEFTLSCFISYLNMPLLKPTPKTTTCKGSSRGNNSGSNS